MFDYIYEWVRNIACYMVLVTAFIQIVPGNDYKKYIRFFTGIILIILLMTPVLKLLGMGSGFWDIYEKNSDGKWKKQQNYGIIWKYQNM